MPKSKTEKPKYVPKEGWFFDLHETSYKSKVWFDGKPVPNVQSVKIEASAGQGLLKATVTLLGDINGRIEIPKSKVERIERKLAPWNTK